MEGVLCSYFIIFSMVKKISLVIFVCSHIVLYVNLKFFLKKEKVNIQR